MASYQHSLPLYVEVPDGEPLHEGHRSRSISWKFVLVVGSLLIVAAMSAGPYSVKDSQSPADVLLASDVPPEPEKIDWKKIEEKGQYDWQKCENSDDPDCWKKEGKRVGSYWENFRLQMKEYWANFGHRMRDFWRNRFTPTAPDEAEGGERVEEAPADKPTTTDEAEGGTVEEAPAEEPTKTADVPAAKTHKSVKKQHSSNTTAT